MLVQHAQNVSQPILHAVMCKAEHGIRFLDISQALGCCCQFRVERVARIQLIEHLMKVDGN